MENKTQNETQLGFLSDFVDEDCLTDKFGGLPVSLFDEVLQNPKCVHCSKPLCLVFQITAPLERLHITERVLYLFSCNNAQCSQHSWALLRSQLPPPAPSPPPPAPAPLEEPGAPRTDHWNSLISNIEENKEEDWGDDQGDSWGVGSSADHEDLESLLKMRELCVSEKPLAEPKKQEKPVNILSTPKTDPSMPSFSPVYIEWSLEPPEKNEKLNVPQEWMEDATSEWQGEEYEQDVDKIWKKFKKTISREPEQCLRYGDTPLTQKKIELKVPKCEYCSSERIFEVQVLPTMLDILESMQIQNSLDFANVLCYTCGSSCQQDKKFYKEFIYKEECW